MILVHSIVVSITRDVIYQRDFKCLIQCFDCTQSKFLKIYEHTYIIKLFRF